MPEKTTFFLIGIATIMGHRTKPCASGGLNKTSFGFSDKVPGSIYRTGRGPLKDFATQKPILSPMNSHKYNKFGRWSIGIGTSGASGYYFYKKLYK